MAEIYCKKCLHYEELGRALRADESCPACGAGVFRRKGAPPRPSSHFPLVLRAIFSMRGIFFLIGFSLIGMVPIGVLAWASIVMLFLGSLKLALKAMNVVGDKIEFPEVSAEELLDKSALIPALAFVFAFVWAPPILLAYSASGVLTFDPSVDDVSAPANKLPAADPMAALLGSGIPSSKAHKQKPLVAVPAIPEQAEIPSAIPGMDNPDVQAALKQAGVTPEMLQNGVDEKAIRKALENAPEPEAHLRAHANLDATRIASALFALLLFLWAPMALILYLRTASTLAMFFLPAGVRTMLNDPLGYIALCMFVLPALVVRFFVDAYTSTTLIAAPPLLFLKGAVVLFSWALCGLYVRRHARAFDLPVDDDDWVQNARGVGATGAVPVVKGALLR